MKKLSIKLKVTLWFTLMMILISSASLFFIIYISEKNVNESISIKLSDAVEDSFKEIDYRFGKIDIDDDLDYYNEGVYLAVYDSKGKLLYGRLPSSFDRTLPFSYGEVRTINDGDHTQYVLDRIWDAGKGNKVTVRGVLSAMGSENAFDTIIKFAMIILPVLTILAATVGYFITKRAFKPVKQIAESAEAISNGDDLTKRIGLGNGNDEIYLLASKFDMMFDRLQSSFENEKRFTSDASHELRTPLAVIMTQCEDALDSQKSEEELREALNIIFEKSKDMASLLASLLTLARADRGHLKLLKERLDLSEICQMVSEEAEIMGTDKNISVKTDIQENIFIEGDQTMIIRMLMNLCENGIKYGRENGILEISLKSENEKAVIEIKDDGCGIEEKNIEKVFERFFREEEARTGGSGLGLPLAKYIAKAHGGDIYAESIKNKGSKFKIELLMGR